MKSTYIWYVVIYLLCLCSTFPSVAQNEIEASEAEIQAVLVYDSLANKLHRSLTHLLSLKVRYVDLITKTDKPTEVKISVYANAAFYFYIENLPTEAIRCYKLLFTEYEHWKQKNISSLEDQYLSERMFAYSIMSRSFTLLNQLDSASIYQKKATSISRLSKSINYPSALNNYGLFLLQNNENEDSIFHYFHKAYEITKNEFPDNPLLGSIRDNLADLYLANGELYNAEEYYKQNFNYYGLEKKDTSRYVSAGIQLINTNLLLNAADEAHNNLEKLEWAISDMQLPPETQLEFWKFKHHYFTLYNKFDSAYTYAQKTLLLSDSLNNIQLKKSNDFNYALKDIVLDRVNLSHQLQQNRQDNQLRTQRFLIGVLALIAILVVTIIYFLYQKRSQRLLNVENERLISDQALRLEKLKSEKMRSDIASKERDLSDFAINLSHNYTWARELYEKFQIINQHKGRARAKLINELETDIRKKINFDTDTKHFLHRLDQLNDAFYNKLDDQFPKLSKTDKRLCSLIRLKLQSQQIANVQNITLASVNTARYRLRKKLLLKDNEDLDYFIVHL